MEEKEEEEVERRKEGRRRDEKRNDEKEEEETLQALEDTKDRTKLHKVESVEALFQELNQ